MPYLERHTHGADKFVLSLRLCLSQFPLPVCSSPRLFLYYYKETMHLFLNGHNLTAMVNSC